MERQKMRTWVEIHLDHMIHNMQAIRRTLPVGTRFLGVVKADAYGHGALPVAARLESEGADYLAVACLEEALELRGGGIRLPILILGHTPPEFVPELLEADLTQTVVNAAAATAYNTAAAARGGRLKIHIKADTGMTRLGFYCGEGGFDRAVAEIAGVCRLPHLVPEGIFTHFAVSDEPGRPASVEYTRAQFQRFQALLSALEPLGIRFPLRHCANSGAVVQFPEMTALDMVRPGLLLYGYGDFGGKLGLLPAMTFYSRLSDLRRVPAGVCVSYGCMYRTERETLLGVVPAGYADGLHRSLSGQCAFYLPATGTMVPQVGRICMDMCMVDLTGLSGAAAGDVVEIFGPHASLEQLAAQAGTIPYELLCAAAPRVNRVYV